MLDALYLGRIFGVNALTWVAFKTFAVVLG